MQTGGVLIVSASTGTGHIRAGEALREACVERDAAQAVEHVDLLNLAPSWVRAMYGGGYELMATRAPWVWQRVYRYSDGEGSDQARWSALAERLLFREFRRLLRSRPWKLCLCTHFLPCQLAARRPGMPPFSLVITDFTLHRYWVQPGVARYFVATESLADDLRPRVGRARVEATGIPVAPAFANAPPRAEARRDLGLDPRRPVAVVIGGGLGLGIAEMAEAVLAGAPPHVQVVAICGRNASARARLRSLGIASERLQVNGYVTGVESYLSAADVVVTKPGGLTTSEALALGRPLLLARPIPGQETGNTRALVAAGAALVAPDLQELREAAGRIFTDEGLLMGLAAAARWIGRPHAARRIADILAREQAESADALASIFTLPERKAYVASSAAKATGAIVQR